MATTLNNSIVVNASTEKVWEALSTLDMLEKFDPTVRQSVLTSSDKAGLGASRKVDMKDGKNWFKEKVTLWEPNKKLAFQLTDCSFPIHGLNYTYVLTLEGNNTRVTQTMTYQMKMGLLGRIMDKLMVKRKTQEGIVKFFGGLKNYVESH